jgi:hypothetical protein
MTDVTSQMHRDRSPILPQPPLWWSSPAHCFCSQTPTSGLHARPAADSDVARQTLALPEQPSTPARSAAASASSNCTALRSVPRPRARRRHDALPVPPLQYQRSLQQHRSNTDCCTRSRMTEGGSRVLDRSVSPDGPRAHEAGIQHPPLPDLPQHMHAAWRSEGERSKWARAGHDAHVASRRAVPIHGWLTTIAPR